MENPFEHLFLGDYIACLIGIFILVVRSFKLAADKFENTEEDFDNLHHLQKNVWDFVLFFLCGFGVLIVIGELYVNNPEFFESIGLKAGGTYHYVLSLLSGLLGAALISAFLSWKKR